MLVLVLVVVVRMLMIRRMRTALAAGAVSFGIVIRGLPVSVVVMQFPLASVSHSLETSSIKPSRAWITA